MIGPNTCRIVYDYFLSESFSAPDGDEDAFVASSLMDSDQVQQEDTMVCESVQRGLQSMGYDVGR